MSIMVSSELLRRYEFFANLDAEVLRELAMAGEILDFPADQALFEEGQSADSLYIVLQGSVIILVAGGGASLREFGVLRLTKGDIFGWSALVKPYRYQLGAKSLTPCKLIRFDGPSVVEIMSHFAYFGYLMMTRVAQIIGERLISLRRQLISLVEGERFESLVGKERVYLFEGGRAAPRDS
jgi:CRP-like cAMP-binding protein